MSPQRLGDLIDRVMTGDPWHGPSVAALLEDVSAAEAARPGPGGTHGIWALVLHTTGWAREVTARLRGRPAQEPDAGDWPEVGDPSPERWAAARRALFEAHAGLGAAIRAMDPALLDQPVTDYRESALGTGLPYDLTLHGLVHHTVYHAGQIGIVKRALRGGA